MSGEENEVGMSRGKTGDETRSGQDYRDALGKSIAQPLARQRIHRYCARLTGDADAAEDLTQETLIEAWRLAERLHDPERVGAWLHGIAANLCLRWRRRRAQEMARRAPGDAQTHLEEREDLESADAFERLEREERDVLLDRALASLTPETRHLLIEHYVKETPHTEIARRLNLSDNAASVRLHRARRRLHQELTTTYWREAAAVGLAVPEQPEQRTTLWCPFCGKGRLFATVSEDGGFKLVCRGCHFIMGPRVSDFPSDCIFAHHRFRPAALLNGVHGYKPSLNRLLSFWHGYFERGKELGWVNCVGCGRRLSLSSARPAHLKPRPFAGLNVHCADCRKIHVLLPTAFALAHPSVQTFWRQQRRIRLSPAVALPGSDAFLLTAESVTSAARRDILFRASDYRIVETR